MPRPAVLLLLPLLFAPGCGPSGPVTLTGKATVAGRAIPNGDVMVQSDNGEVATGAIDNGTYTVAGVRPGKLKIAVIPGSSPAEKAAMPTDKAGGGRTAPAPGRTGGAAAAGNSGSRIPPEYQALDKTPVTHDTSSGLVKDIEIP